MSAEFYVYEHRRADTGAVFYVGKGSNQRLNSTQGRNPFWCAVKAKAGGFIPVKVAFADDEELIYLAEAELIDKYKRLGVRLCNLSPGGEGGGKGVKRSAEYCRMVSERQRGKKRPELSAALKGIKKSAEHRAKLSAARIGTKASDETKAKISAGQKGRPSSMKGKTHSEETKRKIGAALKGEKNFWYGKKMHENFRAACIVANTGRVESAETRRKKSESHKGEKNYRYGKPISEEQKARQRATLMANPPMTCPHCGKVCSKGNALRWHFDRCRERK
jgi:hypothetical protein